MESFGFLKVGTRSTDHRMWGLEMPITDHPLHAILTRESRLTVSERWAQRHCSLVPASELDLGPPDSAIGIFSTGTYAPSCEFILTIWTRTSWCIVMSCFSNCALTCVVFSFLGIAFQVLGLRGSPLQFPLPSASLCWWHVVFAVHPSVSGPTSY